MQCYGLSIRSLNTENIDLDHAYVISSVEDEEVGQNRDLKTVIRFSNDGCPLVCKKTIGQALQRLFGRDDDDWIDKSVIFRLGDTEYNGKAVKTILVDYAATKKLFDEAPKPEPKSPPKPSTDDEKDIPF